MQCNGLFYSFKIVMVKVKCFRSPKVAAISGLKVREQPVPDRYSAVAQVVAMEHKGQ